MPTKGRLFAGCTVALVTPFRDGEVDEAALRRSVEWHIAQGTPVLSPVGTTGESPTLDARRTRAGDRDRRRDGRRPRQGDGRNGLELHGRGDPLDAIRRSGRSRRLAPGGALLQSPQSRGLVPSFCRDRRVHRFTAGPLQRAGSHRSQHRARDRSSGSPRSARSWPSRRPPARSTRSAN